MNNLNDCLYDCPVIPAVKDEEYIEQCLKSDSEIVFVLYGNICSISDICKLIKESGKKCIVHADLINGLAGKEIYGMAGAGMNHDGCDHEPGDVPQFVDMDGDGIPD